MLSVAAHSTQEGKIYGYVGPQLSTDVANKMMTTGLPLGKEMRQLGTKIFCSVTRQGTEVTIMLPAADGPVTATSKTLAPPGVNNGEHILIVEDMPSVRSFVAEVLIDAGYLCSLAADGDEAIALLRAEPTIKLLLTDVGLPYMTGRELADHARSLRDDLPVLFMTGYAENAANRQNFLGERMDLITKPFHIDELLEKIRQGLEPRP